MQANLGAKNHAVIMPDGRLMFFAAWLIRVQPTRTSRSMLSPERRSERQVSAAWPFLSVSWVTSPGVPLVEWWLT